MRILIVWLEEFRDDLDSVLPGWYYLFLLTSITFISQF